MKNSRIFIASFALTVLCFGVYSCEKEKQASKIELSETEIQISEGETHKLSFKVIPEEMLQVATWRALDPEIATVTSEGLVTGIGGGVTYVTATSGTVTSGCKVIVVAHVSGVRLDRHECVIERDGVFRLTPEIIPSTAFNKNVSWSSSDPAVAFVGNGIVTGLAVGKADIVVKTEEGGFTDTCHVEVISTVKEIKLDRSSAKINKGESLDLIATVLPEDATYKDIVWSTSDDRIAAVNEKGTVTARGRGKCIITATSAQAPSVSASCEIEVYVPVESVAMEEGAVNIYVGDRKQLKATVLPVDANNQVVSWSSNASAVAKVVLATGWVTAVSAGTAIITVKTSEGGFTDVCTVTVIQGTEAVTGVELDVTNLRLRVGGTAELFANVLPVNSANKGVTWKSSDTAIASVDTNGKVTAKGAGECTITVTTKEGGFTATCAVTVVGMDAPIPDGLDEDTYIWQN